MERKDKVYSYISTKEYIPLKLDELKSVLCVPVEDSKEFENILSELVDEGKIFLTRKKRYELTSRAGLVRGRLSCNSVGRFGFVINDDGGEDIFITPSGLLDAYHNDTVLCAIDTKGTNGAKAEGHIVKIIKRGNEKLTGVIKKSDGLYYHISPDSMRIYASVRIPIEHAQDAKIGDRVLAVITSYPEAGKINAIAEKNLGNADDLKSYVEGIICEHSIKQEFEEETIKEAANAPKRVSQKEISKRLDLRDKLIITIDGDDARDYDDAISIERLSDGSFFLGVHIADVTEYVTPDSAIDKEAFQRGTSVYLADRVIPMLPVELSNGICSLNPHVNRLALSVFMKIDKNGNITFDSLKKTVIRSSERMTYDDVAALLENPSEKLLKKYSYIMPTLKDMNELCSVLQKRRQERGSINFDFPEAKISVDETGKPVEIYKYERKISHKIIEEFMLAANETIAELAFWAELPFVYRVHEPPSIEKTEEFNRFLHNFNYGIKEKFSPDNPVHPTAFCKVLDDIKGTPEEEMISTYMLRSLMKAEYRPENLGHFGLAAKYYCHFTSPIRRYPDLIIHRILKAYIDLEDVSGYSHITPSCAAHSSNAEIEAEYCERDVDDLMKAAYMSAFIGRDFSGVVSSVTKFGIFVRLDNTVEGLIRLENMKDDFYEYDEEKKTVCGKNNKKIYKIGECVEVVLVNCDLATRRIDFVRCEDYSSEILRKFKKTKQKIISKKPKRSFGKALKRRKRNK